LGECYAELGDLENSIAMYETLLEIEPRNKEIQKAILVMCEDLGQEERAHELLVKCNSKLM
jgi:tetratricopeptide (TPR) repeat protein